MATMTATTIELSIELFFTEREVAEAGLVALARQARGEFVAQARRAGGVAKGRPKATWAAPPADGGVWLVRLTGPCRLD